jgi:hypothetical protein
VEGNCFDVPGAAGTPPDRMLLDRFLWHNPELFPLRRRREIDDQSTPISSWAWPNNLQQTENFMQFGSGHRRDSQKQGLVRGIPAIPQIILEGVLYLHF